MEERKIVIQKLQKSLSDEYAIAQKVLFYTISYKQSWSY